MGREVLHWSHYEDDECIEECPGCLREQVIEAASWFETFEHGRVGEAGATALVDRLVAAIQTEPDLWLCIQTEPERTSR